MGKIKRLIMTPEIAEKFLSRNYEGNRPIRNSKVAELVHDIKSGRWNELAAEQDRILFDENGMLINGQHRCTACIQANIPIVVYIETEVPHTVYEFLDGGSQRTPSDFINAPNAKQAAAFAKYICGIEDGNLSLASVLNGKIRYENGLLEVATRADVIEKEREMGEEIQRFLKLGARCSTYIGGKKTMIAEALYTIEFVGRGSCIEAFVEDHARLVPETNAVSAGRSYMAAQMSKQNFNASKQWVFGNIFFQYEYFASGETIGSYNKVNTYFSKYDKLVRERRNKK